MNVRKKEPSESNNTMDTRNNKIVLVTSLSFFAWGLETSTVSLSSFVLRLSTNDAVAAFVAFPFSSLAVRNCFSSRSNDDVVVILLFDKSSSPGDDIIDACCDTATDDGEFIVSSEKGGSGRRRRRVSLLLCVAVAELESAVTARRRRCRFCLLWICSFDCNATCIIFSYPRNHFFVSLITFLVIILLNMVRFTNTLRNFTDNVRE
mmetsp:Transcript_9597/g.9332  ORF Transcript_9597/g.9332 Transcript_9597/m.9332 type:complete len:206 (+) Transcript_9597:532-1149(+)